MNYRSSGLGPPGRQSYFSVDDCSKRGFLLVTQGKLDSAWAAQSIGLGERLRWKWWWVLSRKVVKPSQIPSWKRELRPEGQDTPEEQWRPTRLPQQHTKSKSRCEAWRKMLPKWRWEIMKQVIMGRMLVLSMWVEVEDGIEDRVPHDYWETLPVDLPLQEEGVQSREVNRVPISQPWLEGLGRVTKQEG